MGEYHDMKIPHIDKASGYTDAQVRYCRTFPDWELDLENYPEFLFGPDPIGVWDAPDSLFDEAVRLGKPLSVQDLLRALYYTDGKWSAGGADFATMEDMVAGTDWEALIIY